jgi:hypothetical protein
MCWNFVNGFAAVQTMRAVARARRAWEARDTAAVGSALRSLNDFEAVTLIDANDVTALFQVRAREQLRCCPCDLAA